MKTIKQGKDRIKEKNKEKNKAEGKGTAGVIWKKWEYPGLDFTN